MSEGAVHAFPEPKALRLALLAALLSLGGAILFGSLAREPGDFPGSAPSPVPASELAGQGGRFFAVSCAECHGEDARGDEGPDLHRLPVSNAYIRSVIAKGIRGEMPSFSKAYDSSQQAALVAYLRTLE